MIAKTISTSELFKKGNDKPFIHALINGLTTVLNITVSIANITIVNKTNLQHKYKIWSGSNLNGSTL